MKNLWEFGHQGWVGRFEKVAELNLSFPGCVVVDRVDNWVEDKRRYSKRQSGKPGLTGLGLGSWFRLF